MVFHIITHLKLAKLNGLPQAEVLLKHTNWQPISRRVQERKKSGRVQLQPETTA